MNSRQLSGYYITHSALGYDVGQKYVEQQFA